MPDMVSSNPFRRPNRSPFDSIRHIDQDDRGEFEWWSSREAMPCLGYSRWENVQNVIRKAKSACRNSGHQTAEHFRDITKTPAQGGPTQHDTQLSRFGMYLVAMNGDPDKPTKPPRLQRNGVSVHRFSATPLFADSPVVDKKSLGGGANTSILATLEGGEKGVYKPSKGEATFLRDGIDVGTYFRREVAAYRFGKLLGFDDLIPLTEFREEGDDVGSIQKFVSGAKVAARLYGDSKWDGPEDAARAALFDYIMANTDRHEGNWMLRDDGKLVLIDNGLSFPHKMDQGEIVWSNNAFLIRAGRKNTPIPDISMIKGKWSELEKTLHECGIEKGGILKTKQRYEEATSGKYTHFSELPFEFDDGSKMTVKDIIVKRGRTT